MGPKAELHVHLEGSIDAETLLEIDPSLAREEIASSTSFSDFAGFIQAYIWVNRRLRSPADYGAAARRLFERLASEGVTYVEVILSAGMILWKQQEFAPIYDALQREAVRAPLTVRWILDAVRQFGAETAKPVFDLAAERVSAASSPSDWEDRRSGVRRPGSRICTVRLAIAVYTSPVMPAKPQVLRAYGTRSP